MSFAEATMSGDASQALLMAAAGILALVIARSVAF